MSLTPKFETQLRGMMAQDEWNAFYEKCVEWGIPINDESLEYGSVFLECKAWFSLGWEAAKSTVKSPAKSTYIIDINCSGIQKRKLYETEKSYNLWWDKHTAWYSRLGLQYNITGTVDGVVERECSSEGKDE